MLDKLYRLYVILFAKNFYVRFNKFLYHLSLRGMGVLNYKDDIISGEENFINTCLKGLNKGIILDVGANTGNYSKKLLRANKNVQVYAFEPHPATFTKLTSNIQSENFQPFNLGVGQEDGKLELFDSLNEDGSSHASFYKEVIENIHKRKSISHTVPVIRLDKFLIENNIDCIDLLKIDTEGNELNVLKGLGKYLEINNEKIKTIHFEFNEMNIISKVSFKDFWDLLPNYNFYRLLPKGNLLTIGSYIPILCEIYAYQNIIAILKNK